MLARMHLAGRDFDRHQPNLRGLPWWNETVPVVLPHLGPAGGAAAQSELAYQNHVAASSGYAALPRGPGACRPVPRQRDVRRRRTHRLLRLLLCGRGHLAVRPGRVPERLVHRPAHRAHAAERARHALLAPTRRCARSRRPSASCCPPCCAPARCAFWISRLWDFYLPREASMLKPHDPTHFRAGAAPSVATLVPFVGSALALTLLPAATLGLMAATLEASKGKFPMPTILISAFRAGRERMRAMLTLGALYAVGFLAIMGISTLFDGGKFARLYLLGGKITQELVSAPDFQTAMWVSTALYLPLSMLFWHAPALVHWHGVSPMKSLFFSIVACVRNVGAFTVYGLAWLGVFIAAALVVMLVAGLVGSADFAAAAMVPLMLLLASMFFTSMYFTVRDCFVTGDTEAPGNL
jgi:hypothetical protein